MRIISGKFKNREIKTDKNNNFRPTMTKVREAIFSMLSSLPNFTFDNKNILDLYAGSGILGFECLSRGSQHVTFIDNSISQLAFIKKNAVALQLIDDITLVNQDIAEMIIAENSESFDIIFIDPPYQKDMIVSTLNKIHNSTWLKPETVIIVEVEKSFTDNVLLSFFILKEKKYSDTKIYILTPQFDGQDNEV